MSVNTDGGRVAGLGPVVLVVAIGVLAALGARWARPVRIGPDGSRIGVAMPLPDMRLGLNSVDAETLTVLPGIGPTLAARIVADRAGRGQFTSIDDLTRVDGIGPATVERLREHGMVEVIPSADG